jgi:hypothetical protein
VSTYTDPGTATLNNIYINTSSYKSVQVRNLLIGAIAGVYQAATTTPLNLYFTDPENAKNQFYNVPRMVDAYTEGLVFSFYFTRPIILTYCADSHLSVVFEMGYEGDNKGSWHCCETREYVDKKLDPLLIELKSVYPKPRGMELNVECDEGCSNGQTESNINVDEMLERIMRERL